MGPIFKCSSCRKELHDITEVYYLLGQDIYDPLSGIRYNSGNNMCFDCYKAQTSDVVDLKEPGGFSTTNKILSLMDGQTNVNLVVTVLRKIEVKDVSKDSRKLRLGRFEISDDSGKIILTLWNNIIDLVKIGDVLYLENAFVREFKGKKQLTLGKQGTLKKMS